MDTNQQKFEDYLVSKESFNSTVPLFPLNLGIDIERKILQFKKEFEAVEKREKYFAMVLHKKQIEDNGMVGRQNDVMGDDTNCLDVMWNYPVA